MPSQCYISSGGHPSPFSYSLPPHQGWLDLPVLALFGDPKQLPPTIHSSMAKQLGYNRSLLERQSNMPGAAQHITVLDTQVGLQIPYITHSLSPTSTFTSFTHPRCKIYT